MPTALWLALRTQGLRQVTAWLAEAFPLPILQLSILTLLLLSMFSVKPWDETQSHQSQQQNSTCAEEIQLLQELQSGSPCSALVSVGKRLSKNEICEICEPKHNVKVF